MIDVSVVIPSFNGAQRLPRLLKSLAEQTASDWEALVVLDGSTDESAAIVEWASAIMPVRAIDLGRNMGRPSALNAGFSAAEGRVLVRCDDDLELPPTFLANHVAHHAGDPVGVVGLCPDVFDDTPYARAYGRAADVSIRAMASGLAEEFRWRLWSANVSVTRETYERVGPYDDAYRVYGWEDVDWGYRLHELGIPVIVATDIEALHYNPASSAADRASKALASGASRRLFEARHPHAPLPSAASGQSAWNMAVAIVARGVNDRTILGFGRVADLAVAVLPTWAATKAAALVVEAAGKAGQSPDHRTRSAST